MHQVVMTGIVIAMGDANVLDDIVGEVPEALAEREI